jgi:hypothetical protein
MGMPHEHTIGPSFVPRTNFGPSKIVCGTHPRRAGSQGTLLLVRGS